MRVATGCGIILGSLWLFATGIGCSKPSGAATDISIELDDLYQIYLTADAAQARKSLHDSVKLISEAQLEAFPRANLFFMVYARLYSLESRVGDQDLAEAYLVRARYWYLRREEVPAAVGVPVPEDGIPTMRAAKKVKEATPAWIIEFVDEWDRRKTGGQPAHYLAKLAG